MIELERDKRAIPIPSCGTWTFDARHDASCWIVVCAAQLYTWTYSCFERRVCMPFQPTICVCMRPASVFFHRIPFASLKRISSELQLCDTCCARNPIPLSLAHSIHHTIPKGSLVLALFLVLFWYRVLLFRGSLTPVHYACVHCTLYIERTAPKYIYCTFVMRSVYI